MGIAHRTLALCLLLTPLPLVAQAPQTATVQSSEAALAGLDAFVAETLQKWNVPGVAISVVKDGKVVLSKGYGVRDPATGQPMTNDTIFPIASMSKAFTSFGVALLGDEDVYPEFSVSRQIKGAHGYSDPTLRTGSQNIGEPQVEQKPRCTFSEERNQVRLSVP